MAYHPCGVCKGSGTHTSQNRKGQIFHNPCRVCGGTGQDQRWRSRSCRGCSNYFDYRSDWSNIPEYCESCRNTWYEKNCPQGGCSRTIRYKKSWSNIPNYCKRCETNRSKGFIPWTCNTCGCVTWAPPGKLYLYCRDHRPLYKGGGESHKLKKDGRVHTTRYLNTGLRRSWDHDGHNQDISGDHFVDSGYSKKDEFRIILPGEDES